jgi:hypothetical protein
MKYLLVLPLLFQFGCTTTRYPGTLKKATNSFCEKLYLQSREEKSNLQLDRVSQLYRNRCFTETIELGNHLRKFKRDKFFHLTNEAFELFVPEGSFTEYVMESHERGFLTILMSMSYLNLNELDAALVELRRASEEQRATLYNYGEDPTISMLLAALWDRWDTSYSRPYWKFVSESSQLSENLRVFAKTRLNEIDQQPGKKVAWRIQGFGSQPSLKWESQFLKLDKNPYKVTSQTPLPLNCTEKNRLIVNTESWIQKMNIKYESAYHPYLYSKSLIRLPVGVTYGVLGITGGVAVGIAGCGVASKANSNELCEESLKTAGYLIKSSVDLAAYTLKPDLRRWSDLPSVFLIEHTESHESSEFIGPKAPILSVKPPCSQNFKASLTTLPIIE